MADSIYFSLKFNSSMYLVRSAREMHIIYWVLTCFRLLPCSSHTFIQKIKCENQTTFGVTEKNPEKIVFGVVCNKVHCWILKFTAYSFIISKDNFFRRPETRNSFMWRIALNFIFIFVRLIRVAPLSLLRMPYAVSLHCQKIETKTLNEWIRSKGETRCNVYGERWS